MATKNNDLNQKNIDKMVKQATKIGMGFAIVSKDALEDFIKKNSKSRGISEKEAKQAITDLITESKKVEKQLKEQVKEVIKSAKANNPLISKTEFVKMKAEVEKLKQQLKKKKK